MADTPVRDAPMRRVLVVGCPGAGKSTFARRLGAKLRLPVIHLDFHYWRPGWQLPDEAAWREQVAALVGPPAWVIDGNYANTFDIRIPRADGIVWLDYSRALSSSVMYGTSSAHSGRAFRAVSTNLAVICA